MILLLAVVGTAEAGHQWGIGPTIGTTGFPVEYPIFFPELALGAAGNPLVEPVTFDLDVGIHGVYYLGQGGRVGARFTIGGNFTTFGEQEFTVEYEGVLARIEQSQIFAGGGLGFGHDRFGAAADAANPDAYLDVAYFPLRAQVGVLVRDRTRAYEADLFATFHVAGEQLFSLTGKSEDEVAGTAVADPFGADDTKSDAALYLAIGGEITVYFGDFQNQGGGKSGGGGKRKK